MPYLDHNATSPLRDEARHAMERAVAIGANPSSVHALGRQARSVVEAAREQVADLVGASSKDVIFTSGGTEANVIALNGAIGAAAEAGARITRVFVSAVEHDSIVVAATKLSERSAGLRLEFIPVAADGTVDLAALSSALREGKGRALVAVMAANNETGAIQPLANVVSLVREAGALFLVDAIQAAGKLNLDVARLGADYLTLSAHKIGGPSGVGALVLRQGAPFMPLFGGDQERGRRAGTENLTGIAGFGAAAGAAHAQDCRERIEALRDGFERELKRAVPDAVVFGAAAPRLANTSNFSLPGIPAETALMALDLDGVMVSSGSACSSGRVQPSHVLKAMNVPETLARSALRVSLGWNSTEQDLDEALSSISRLRARFHARAA